MKPNNDKLAFASTINDLNDGLLKGRSRCFDYGSLCGCNIDCPPLQDGECPEVGEFFLHLKMSEENREELLETYKLTEDDIGYYKKNYKFLNHPKI